MECLYLQSKGRGHTRREGLQDRVAGLQTQVSSSTNTRLRVGRQAGLGLQDSHGRGLTVQGRLALGWGRQEGGLAGCREGHWLAVARWRAGAHQVDQMWRSMLITKQAFWNFVIFFLGEPSSRNMVKV